MADNDDIEFAKFNTKNHDEVLGIYHILLAAMIILTSHGFMLGNNGSDGDFALNYCNDADDEVFGITSTVDEEFKELLALDSFFACEIGFIDGVVDLGWEVKVPQYNERIDDVMILNHENYKKFVTGEEFVLDAGLWYLADFDNYGESSPNDPNGTVIMKGYITDIILPSDTYFFVVTRGGLEHYDSKGIYSGDGDNEQCNFGNFDFKLDCQHRAFYYTVDLDYTDEIYLNQPTSTN